MEHSEAQVTAEHREMGERKLGIGLIGIQKVLVWVAHRSLFVTRAPIEINQALCRVGFKTRVSSEVTATICTATQGSSG